MDTNERIRIEYDAVASERAGALGYVAVVWLDGTQVYQGADLWGDQHLAAREAREEALLRARERLGSASVTVVRRGAVEGLVPRYTRPADLLQPSADPSADTVDLGVVA